MPGNFVAAVFCAQEFGSRVNKAFREATAIHLPLMVLNGYERPIRATSLFSSQALSRQHLRVFVRCMARAITSDHKRQYSAVARRLG